jgi:RHS repeat-associated protein
MIKVGVTYYLTYNQVGSLRVISDTSGNVIKRIDYDSFGNIISDTNPGFIVPFGFAGGLHDRDTGIVKLGFRDYSPNVGRWTAKDPIGFWGGDVDLYGYVHNRPTRFVDPLGLWAAGISLEFSTINPFTSGGGGSYGINLEYTSISGLHLYTYATPNDVNSLGFLIGPSIQVNAATGTGDWTGPFESGAGSYGLVTGGFFHSPDDQPDPGYFGLSLGLGKGPPGIGFTRTKYHRMFPDTIPSHIALSPCH